MALEQVPPQAAQAAQQAQQQAQPTPAPPTRPDDRILTPKEAEALFNNDFAGLDQDNEIRKFFDKMGDPGTPAAAPMSRDAVADAAQSMMKAEVPAQVQQPGVVQPVQPQQVAVQQVQQPGVAQPVQQQPSPNELALMAQLAQMQQQVAQLQAAIQAPPQQQQQAQPDPGQYNLQVNPQLRAALASEDPNMQNAALNSLISGMVQEVHGRINRSVEERLQGIPVQMQSALQMQQLQNQVETDFYGTYPELNTPQIRSIIKPMAEQVAREFGMVDRWTPQLRDKIAERMVPYAPHIAQKVQQNQARYGFNPMAVPGQQQPPGIYGSVPVSYPVAPTAPAQFPAQQAQPILARDQNGNLVQVVPAHQYVAPGTVRGGESMVDPQVRDIWNTLGYNTGF